MTTNESAVAEAAASARLELAKQALVPFETAHRELLALWSSLETKAQGATAIAGIFLGATITILTRNPNSLTDAQKILVAAIALTLGLAVVLSLLALVPRSVAAGTKPETRLRRVKNLLALSDDSEFLSRLEDFYVEDEKNWVNAIEGCSAITSQKASLLFSAHVLCGVAIFGAVVLVGELLGVFNL